MRKGGKSASKGGNPSGNTADGQSRPAWPSAASVRRAGGGPNTGKQFSAFGVTVPQGPGQFKAAKLKARALAGSEGVPAQPNIAGHAVRGGLHQSTLEMAWKRIRLTRYVNRFEDLSTDAQAALHSAEPGESGYIDYSHPPFSNAELSIYSRIQRCNNRRVIAPPGISPASFAVSVLYGLQTKAEFRKKFTQQLTALRGELQSYDMDPHKIYAQEWKLWGITLVPERALPGTFSKLFVEWTAAPENWSVLYTTRITMPGGAHLHSDAEASAAYLSGGIVAANEPVLASRKRRRLQTPTRSAGSNQNQLQGGVPAGTPPTGQQMAAPPVPDGTVGDPAAKKQKDSAMDG